MLTISESDYKALAAFVQKHYGINLYQKKSLIENRLHSTVLSMGYHSFSDYVRHITIDRTPADVEIMLNRLTTNYTFFMRESEHFDFFKNTILPWIEKTRKDRCMSIWSAGCSTGEEPYTISMIIKEFLGTRASLWDTRVLATDLSQNALNGAAHAEYSEDALKNLPDGWKRKYFLKTALPGRYTVTPAIRSNVIFRSFNLMDPIEFRIKFDVIFCRNVMIYFDLPTRDALVKRFHGATNPNGYLLTGHSEALNKSTSLYKCLKPATYVRQSVPSPGIKERLV